MTRCRSRFCAKSGRYLLGFLHPMLDSEGLEPRLHEGIVTSKSRLTDFCGARCTLARRGNRTLMEFMQRKKSSGTGKFITSEDIASRNPLYIADLFRTVAGIDIDRDRNGDDSGVLISLQQPARRWPATGR